MATWGEFAERNPQLAEFGESRFRIGVAYLATVRKDGSPRVHPVSPVIGREHLFVFMEPTSPKGDDLRRDPRYSLHSLVSDPNGTGGEFLISGRAELVTDQETRELATRVARASGFSGAERYVLFELEIEEALSTVYQDNRPVRQRWSR